MPPSPAVSQSRQLQSFDLVPPWRWVRLATAGLRKAPALETVPFVMLLFIVLAPAAGVAAATVPFVIALAVVALPESVVSGIGSQSK